MFDNHKRNREEPYKLTGHKKPIVVDIKPLTRILKKNKSVRNKRGDIITRTVVNLSTLSLLIMIFPNLFNNLFLIKGISSILLNTTKT